jgi:hypothetical protein
MKKIAIVLLCAFGCDKYFEEVDKQAQKEMAVIERRAVDDQIEQYMIAQRAKDKMQMCVQAGFIAAMHMQAKNEKAWNEWRVIEKRDCRRVNVTIP